MSDIVFYTTCSMYNGIDHCFEDDLYGEYEEQQYEVGKAAKNVVSQVATKPTNSSVKASPAKSKPLNKISAFDKAHAANKVRKKSRAEAQNAYVMSKETKENLSNYLSKSCDMHVSHNIQARGKADDMNTLLKGVATRPFEKVHLSSDLNAQVENAVAQKNTGEYKADGTVYNAMFNLEAFAQIAKNSDSTVRATCAANSIGYVAHILSDMKLKISSSVTCNNFMEVAFPYLACENADEAKQLQAKLEQLMVEIDGLGFGYHDRLLANVINIFIRELISQKNECFETLNNSSISINGGKADFLNANGLFAIEQDANGDVTIVSSAQKSLSVRGAIAKNNVDIIANDLSSTAYIANNALESIKNNNLNQAKMEIACVGVNNKEAQALVQGVYDQQVEKNSNSIVDFILTPKSERIALSNINNDGTNLTDKSTSASRDITKFDAENFADVWSMYKQLNSLSNSPQNLFEKITKNSSLEATQAKKGAVTHNPLLNQDVFNKTVSMLKDIVSSHEGFAADQKEQIANIENDIAKKLKEIDEVKLDEEEAAQQLRDSTKGGYVSPEKIQNLALDNMAKKKAKLIDDIHKDHQMIASCLRDGLTEYVNKHMSGEKFANMVLAEHGINSKEPLGSYNKGVTGLLDTTSFDSIAAHPLGNNNNDAPKYIVSKIIDAITGVSESGNSESDDVIKDILGSKGKESIDNFDKGQSNEDKQIAFNQGKRIIGAYAALGNDLGYLAHLLAPATATDTDTQASDDKAQNPAINSSEIEKLFDLISNRDNADLCQKILDVALATKDQQTVADLGKLLQGIVHGYDHENKQTNNIVNTKLILDNLLVLKSNHFFKELGDDNSLLMKAIKSYKDPNNTDMYAEQKIALEGLDTAYHNFVHNVSYENTLKLILALHNCRPEFISLDINDFKAFDGSLFDGVSERSSKWDQLTSGLSFLNKYGETLVDLAYAAFQLDKGIKLDYRWQSDENSEFFAAINTLSAGKEDDLKHLLYFMADNPFRASTDSSKVLNAAVGTVVKSMSLPTEKTLEHAVENNTWVNKQHNKLTDFHFYQYPNENLKDTLNKEKILASDIGNYQAFVNIGLTNYHEGLSKIDLDNFKSDRNKALAKAGITEETVNSFLTQKAIKSNEGETQAAAIRMALALLSDYNFTRADITYDLVSLYLGDKASPKVDEDRVQVAVNRPIVGMKVKQNEIFLALDAARKGNRAQNDCAYLVRALYNQYQIASDNAELKGKAFDDLSQEEYKAMLSSYYNEFNMPVPFDLEYVGPRKTQSVKELSYKDKSAAFKHLSKAICNFSHFNLDPKIKEELAKNFEILTNALEKAEKLEASARKVANNDSEYGPAMVKVNKNQFVINDAIGAIYSKLTSQPGLLEVCDFVMMNKSLTNVAEKKSDNIKTLDRMFHKIFDSKDLEKKISSQVALDIVKQNYITSTDIKQKSNMEYVGEAQFVKEIQENPQTNALFNTSVNHALLDVADLYGQDSILAFAKDNIDGLLKSVAINGENTDFTVPDALKAKLPISEEQIKSLEQKGINVTQVKIDANGNAVFDKKMNADVKPSQANSDTIELNVYKTENGNLTVAFNELLSASLALKIDVEQHNQMMFNDLKYINIVKDLDRLPGTVNRQDIAKGLVDALVREPKLVNKDFFKQSTLGVQADCQNKLNTVQTSIDDFISSIKDNPIVIRKLGKIVDGQKQSSEAENVAVLSDVLISMDDNSVIGLDKDKKIKLFNLNRDLNLDGTQDKVNAEIASSMKDSFIVNRDDGTFKISLAKALALKISGGFEADEGAGAGAGAGVGAGAVGNVSYTFNNEKDAALFLHTVLMRSAEHEQLNGVDIVEYAKGKHGVYFKPQNSMVFNIGESNGDKGQDQIQIDGLIPTNTKDKESESSQVGAQASWSFTNYCKGEKRVTRNESYYGFNNKIFGTIRGEAEIGAAQQGENVGNQQLSAAKVAIINYEANLEVRASNVSRNLESAVRTDNYTFENASDLAATLALYSVPSDKVESLLKLHGKTPIRSISFESEFKPMPEIDLSSPALTEKKNYDITKLVIEFVDDKTPSSINTSVFEKNERQTIVRSIDLEPSYLLSQTSDVEALEKAWRKALEL